MSPHGGLWGVTEGLNVCIIQNSYVEFWNYEVALGRWLALDQIMRVGPQHDISALIRRESRALCHGSVRTQQEDNC
jgi:hypothetical protein